MILKKKEEPKRSVPTGAFMLIVKTAAFAAIGWAFFFEGMIALLTGIHQLSVFESAFFQETEVEYIPAYMIGAARISFGLMFTILLFRFEFGHLVLARDLSKEPRLTPMWLLYVGSTFYFLGLLANIVLLRGV